MVKFDQVSKIYERGGDIITGLDRVTIEVGKGDFCAFIGPSGCGKSTLLNLVGGLDVPTSGEILLERAFDQWIHERRLDKGQAGNHWDYLPSIPFNPRIDGSGECCVSLIVARGARSFRPSPCCGSD